MGLVSGEKAKKEKTAKDFDKVIEKMGKILENQVKEVKISNRLSESPSCLVALRNK
jgi:molecular chaperone HtpG